MAAHSDSTAPGRFFGVRPAQVDEMIAKWNFKAAADAKEKLGYLKTNKKSSGLRHLTGAKSVWEAPDQRSIKGKIVRNLNGGPTTVFFPGIPHQQILLAYSGNPRIDLSWFSTPERINEEYPIRIAMKREHVIRFLLDWGFANRELLGAERAQQLAEYWVDSLGYSADIFTNEAKADLRERFYVEVRAFEAKVAQQSIYTDPDADADFIQSFIALSARLVGGNHVTIINRGGQPLGKAGQITVASKPTLHEKIQKALTEGSNVDVSPLPYKPAKIHAIAKTDRVRSNVGLPSFSYTKDGMSYHVPEEVVRVSFPKIKNGTSSGGIHSLEAALRELNIAPEHDIGKAIIATVKARLDTLSRHLAEAKAKKDSKNQPGFTVFLGSAGGAAPHPGVTVAASSVAPPATSSGAPVTIGDVTNVPFSGGQDVTVDTNQLNFL